MLHDVWLIFIELMLLFDMLLVFVMDIDVP